jgi:hypothetical protein
VLRAQRMRLFSLPVFPIQPLNALQLVIFTLYGMAVCMACGWTRRWWGLRVTVTLVIHHKQRPAVIRDGTHQLIRCIQSAHKMILMQGFAQFRAGGVKGRGCGVRSVTQQTPTQRDRWQWALFTRPISSVRSTGYTKGIHMIDNR